MRSDIENLEIKLKDADADTILEEDKSLREELAKSQLEIEKLQQVKAEKLQALEDCVSQAENYQKQVLDLLILIEVSILCELIWKNKDQ